MTVLTLSKKVSLAAIMCGYLHVSWAKCMIADGRVTPHRREPAYGVACAHWCIHVGMLRWWLGLFLRGITWIRICVPRKVNSDVNIQDWSEDIILVELLQEPQEQDELQRIIDWVRKRGDCDVIVDFSGVETAGGAMFTQLLELRKLL